MPRLVMTTVLVCAVSTGFASAQTSGTTPMTGTSAQTELNAGHVPEGFALRDGAGFDDLGGAELYDAMDTKIGTVVEVIHPGDIEANNPAAGETTNAADASTGAEPSIEAGDTPVGDGGPMEAEATGSSGVGPIAGAGTGDTEGTVANPAVEGTPPEPTGETEAAPVTGAAGTASEGNQEEGASKLGHAIVDIDNFPGVGQHRVAVPLSELQIYQSDAELRVYIARTRDELQAVRAYDPNDPSTLGAFSPN